MDQPLKPVNIFAYSPIETSEEVLGKGSDGDVVLGKYEGTVAAIKLYKEGNDARAANECRMLNCLRHHPCIVQTHGMNYIGKLPALVLVYYTQGTLDKY